MTALQATWRHGPGAAFGRRCPAAGRAGRAGRDGRVGSRLTGTIGAAGIVPRIDAHSNRLRAVEKTTGNPGGGEAGASGEPGRGVQEPPVVAATPALKGYPGGPGLPDAAADAAAAAACREAHGHGGPSVWQRAQQAWRDSGVEWQRPAADWEPAEAEWERVQDVAADDSAVRSGGGLWRVRRGAVRSRGGLWRVRRGAVKSAGGRWHIRRAVWLAAIAAIVIVALVVAGFLVFGGQGGGGAGAAAVAPYPPARLAGADFRTDPGQRARGIFQWVSAVAAAGRTIVAVGSLTGPWLPRAQFLVSADGGRSWRLAPVRGPGGSVPPPADLPLLAAGGAARPGGRGGWLAVGGGAAWTSTDGKTWALAPGKGIAPVRAADRVLALASTGRGFLAVGENAPGGHQAKASPVAWTSGNGLSWQRRPAARLHLAAPAGGRVLRLTRVAARGDQVIVEGEIARAHGRGKRRVVSLSDRVWRSGNGGRSWAPARLPAGRGATSRIAGLAVAGQRFVALRPGRTPKAGRDAVAYVSSGGARWNRAATITAAKRDHLRVTAVGGSDQGAV